MKIAIGSDHIGYDYKQMILAELNAMGHNTINCGPFSDERADYPIYGEKVAKLVASGECDLGVLICGTGIGISLAANKVKGIRAAVCSETYSAAMARKHNNANIISLGARVVGTEVAKEIVFAFLSAQFEGERHARRVDMITQIEASQ